jgi:hypothetical protein
MPKISANNALIEASNFNLYDPTQASTPIGTGLAVPGLQVTLSDHPVIIQIL